MLGIVNEDNGIARVNKEIYRTMVIAIIGAEIRGSFPDGFVVIIKAVPRRRIGREEVYAR